jgi:hypothetical protein
MLFVKKLHLMPIVTYFSLLVENNNLRNEKKQKKFLDMEK